MYYPVISKMREVVAAPSLEVLKAGFKDGALSSLF